MSIYWWTFFRFFSFGIDFKCEKPFGFQLISTETETEYRVYWTFIFRSVIVNITLFYFIVIADWREVIYNTASTITEIDTECENKITNVLFTIVSFFSFDFDFSSVFLPVQINIKYIPLEYFQSVPWKENLLIKNMAK